MKIKTEANQPITFHTNTGAGLFNPVPRMTILGPSGFVGIGLPAPGWRLDVQDNTNVTSSALVNQGYRIDNALFLQAPGGVGFGNTLVGNTGNTTLVPTGNSTFIGFNSGNAAVSADATYVGANTGMVDISSGGVYVGYQAGQANTTGDNNVFVGRQAGLINTTGQTNVFAGFNAGGSNVSGNSNVCVGVNSGAAINTNLNNVIIGPFANSTAGINNAIAMGSNAIVRNTQQMILGDNTINVGIGLSNDPTGPQKKLEIKDNTIAAPNLLNPH